MRRLTMSCLVIAALLLDAGFAAGAAVRARHLHRRLFVPGPHWNWPIGNEGFGPSGGNIFTRDNGSFNTMGNDFGTSGVLGHTNGLPAGASTFIYH